MPMQINPDELIGILTGPFQPRVEPNFALAKCISTHLALTGLRGFWPMSSVAYAQPECLDISGNGNHLQAAVALGNVLFSRGGISLEPSAYFGGAANQYLTRADGGAGNWADILGTEAYIMASMRGLTLGGWFYINPLPGAVTFLIGKDDGGANRQYELILLNTNLLRWEVGAGASIVDSTATVIAGWNHCVGRYDQPSQRMYVYLNGVRTTGVAPFPPAALGDTAASFTIGGDAAAGRLLSGYASMCFLCASALSDTIIWNLYQQTRTMYGV